MSIRSLALFATLAAACGDDAAPAPEAVPAPPELPPRPLVAPIEIPAASGAMAPSLVAAGDAVLMTWVERIGESEPFRHRVRLATYRDGRFGEPVTIVEGDDLFANWADFPTVVAAGDGTIFAFWMRRAGAARHAYGIEAGRSDDGGRTFRPLGPLHDDGTPTEHGFLSLLPLREGARAFWLDGRETVGHGEHGGGATTLRTAVVDTGVHDGALLDPRVCDCCQTAAVDAPSGAVVFYRDRSDAELRDIGALQLVSGGAPQQIALAADGWEIRGCPVNGPAAAADAGTVAAAWFTAAGGRETVQVAFATDGGRRFSAPVIVDHERPLGRVDVELSGGEAIVCWLARGEGEGDAAEALVRVRRAAPDGRLGEPVTVATTTAARASGFPRTAMNGGRLFIAWTAPGPPSRVRAATIDPARLPPPTRRAEAPRRPTAELTPSPLPSYRARSLDGAEVALDEIGDGPLLVAFFATWCEPCVEELRLLARLHEELGGRGLRVAAISIDDLPTAEVARFAERHGLRYRVLHDADDGAARAFGVPPLPALFLYDGERRLVFREVGATERTLTELPDAVRALLRP